MRHEASGQSGTLALGDHASLEVPLAVVARVAWPNRVVGPYAELGGGVSYWSIPIRVDAVLGTQRIDAAWTAGLRAAVGARVLSYLDGFAEFAVHGVDDLGGMGSVFVVPAVYVGGGVGFTYGDIGR